MGKENRVEWSEIKTFIDSRGVVPQYYTYQDRDHIYAFDGPLCLYCQLRLDPTENADVLDWQTNYKSIANQNLKDRDITGREVIRTAATIRGWHYQFHSVEFTTCDVDSCINEDINGNDLGLATLKVFKADGTECSDQMDANINGVKTVMYWKPTFDFEIISGNTRQESKQNQNMRMYTNAKVVTGLPSPYDWFTIPFVQGGLNLKYIGADEILKTDGRASKLLKGSNGDHFEITIKHPTGVKHELSIVFEIYKDPQT